LAHFRGRWHLADVIAIAPYLQGSRALGAGLLLVLTAIAGPDGHCEDAPAAAYRLNQNITSTVFWIGERADSAYGPIANASSAWDEDWLRNYGGIDDPLNRDGYRPAAFAPKENPFYCALPYNDFAGGRRKAAAARVVPWAKQKVWGERESMCKNRWVRITREDRAAYAQWEDVGPFETDDSHYVFGQARPRNRHNQCAGIDVSPAVRDYLSLEDVDRVDWQFVEAKDVPAGPWKAIVTTSGVTWH
jgi:hypothetical protein